jgi:hypothetical protein
MRRISTVFALTCVLAFTISCSTVKKLPVSIDPGVAVQAPKISLPMGGLSSSDIFQGDEFLVGGDWSLMGKMLTAPSATKSEAEFLVYSGKGTKKWSDEYHKVKAVNAAGLKAGDDVFYFHGNEEDGVRNLPKDKSNAQQEYWRKGLVTDTSLLASRGIVYVGQDRVNKDNVFVAEK